MTSLINTSGIDETKPTSGTATTQSVRDNTAEIKTQLGNAKTDIESLQSDVNALAQAVVYRGSWDASSGTAPASSPDHGDMYRVTVAGTWDGRDWDVGDEAIYNSNNTTWEKFDNTSEVASVNGYTGVVSLDNADVGLGNLTNDQQVPKSGGTFDGAITVPGITVNDTTSNAQGTKTVSTSSPSGGADGDVWYQV